MSTEEGISFFSESNFSLENESGVLTWLLASAKAENKTIGFLNVIFLDDDGLLAINKEYLKHDYYTDVITFDYNDNELVNGEVFISIDRIKENASELNISFNDELHRVIIHGLLHLFGYKDKSAEDKQLMRSKEDYYLPLRPF